MTNVYIVKTSNCESYEDYCESIDSVWLNRTDAVAHIENDLGMEQVNAYNPSLRWSRDRWEKEYPELPKREEFDTEEEWAEAHDENGKLIPYWVNYRDAWIEEYPLNI